MIHVEQLSPNSKDGGLHRFRLQFPDSEGECLITRGEAMRVDDLNCSCVEAALRRLAGDHGWEHVSRLAATEPGLLLHARDLLDACSAEAA